MTPPKSSSRQQHNAWLSLRSVTTARIALGTSGVSIPLKESLAFRLAHAHARDAVYSMLDMATLVVELRSLGLPAVELASRVCDRQEYLRRPDLGRQLSESSIDLLQSAGIARNQDVAIILADGLSATAINNHAIPFLKLLMPSLSASGISLAPIALVEHGRVAIGDEIGELLKVKLSVILIGERPGLSSPDSMGVYFTYQPKVGLTDDSRNCLSNIRPAGLLYQAAAEKLFYLIKESLRLKISGVNLKDNASLPGEQVTTA